MIAVMTTTETADIFEELRKLLTYLKNSAESIPVSKSLRLLNTYTDF